MTTVWSSIKLIEVLSFQFSNGVLDLDTFYLRRGSERMRVRRLSTKSYIHDSDDNHFTTCWIWYWKDDLGNWNAYSAVCIFSNISFLKMYVLRSP